jgi:SnoaL-like domain
MSEPTRTLVEAHWLTANDRNWPGFSALLHPDLRYEVPQTREYIEGGEGYLDMFRTWPGNWTANIREFVCEGHKAVTIIDFVVGHETMTGITVFEAAGGFLTKVTDYWPEPYEPPRRETAHLRRHE